MSEIIIDITNNDTKTSSGEQKNNAVSVGHEQFNLKSSQTQPFDFDRMSGRSNNSSKGSGTASKTSESDKGPKD